MSRSEGQCSKGCFWPIADLQIQQNNDRMAELTVENQYLGEEVERAVRAAKKIRDLIS